MAVFTRIFQTLVNAEKQSVHRNKRKLMHPWNASDFEIFSMLYAHREVYFRKKSTIRYAI